MNSKEIFTIALNIGEPWYVKEILMTQEKESITGQVDIYIDFKVGSTFADATGEQCHIHDTVERTWQHLNFFQHTCYIHARVPRIIASNNKIKRIEVPWARPQSGFTLLYEAFAMLMIESEMPVKKAAKVLNIYDTRLWRIFKYWIARAFSSDEQSGVVNVGIDETSSKKGHKYVSIAVDMEERRVIFAKSGRDSSILTSLKEHLQSKGCNSNNIENISIDMSPAFISGAIKNFPNAKITFDKFHIIKLINEAMDMVRKSERRQHMELKGHRYLFLRNPEKQTEEDKQSKNYFLSLYEELGNAYRLKEMFNDFWKFAHQEEASAYLAYWCDMAEDSKIRPFMHVAKTIRTHWTGIVNFFKSKLNNGILEGINSKIQLAKRRARGYRNTDNFINMIPKNLN